MVTDYRVEPARQEHLSALPEIERAAARRFEAVGVVVDVDDVTPLSDFARAWRDGGVWVALARDDTAVGFALVHRHGTGAHLEEVDVHPDHGRRGLGARLVRAVCDWARDAGLPEVTLTTFRDVPWNAPFYRRLGFEEVPVADAHPELRAIVEEEATSGLDPAARVIMRRRL